MDLQPELWGFNKTGEHYDDLISKDVIHSASIGA